MIKNDKNKLVKYHKQAIKNLIEIFETTPNHIHFICIDLVNAYQQIPECVKLPYKHIAFENGGFSKVIMEVIPKFKEFIFKVGQTLLDENFDNNLQYDVGDSWCLPYEDREKINRIKVDYLREYLDTL